MSIAQSSPKVIKVQLDQCFSKTSINVYRPGRGYRCYAIPSEQWNTPRGARRMLRGLRLFNACLRRDWEKAGS